MDQGTVNRRRNARAVDEGTDDTHIRRKRATKKRSQSGTRSTVESLKQRVAQTLYYFVCFGSWAIIFIQAYPLIDESSTVSSYHKIIGYFVFAFCFASWRYARGTDPGNITEETLCKFDNYPYDGVLFRRDNICPTLHIRKLARSKYDRYTNKHIPRFDHFCGWLGVPIGEENYRFFLLFLMVHAGMCWYGLIATFRLLWGEVLKETSPFFAYLRNSSSFKGILLHAFAMAHTNGWLFYVIIIMGTMSVFLSLFLCFHFYILLNGMTTNEYFKWKEVADIVKSQQKSGVPQGQGGNGGDVEEAVACIRSGRMPQNIYDLGFFSNTMEVLRPRSMRTKNI